MMGGYLFQANKKRPCSLGEDPQLATKGQTARLECVTGWKGVLNAQPNGLESVSPVHAKGPAVA